ncbi:MAG: GIY-YIG nuclease family protein [Candidatus Paceibacterota bacterium]
MPQSPLRLIKKCLEDISIDQINKLPKGLRGFYVLYNDNRVVYVGIATGQGGIRQRLKRHRASKPDFWTTCSIFEVWDNIRDDEIKELEGLFRHIYRHDPAANELNLQRGFKQMKLVTVADVSAFWP